MSNALCLPCAIIWWMIKPDITSLCANVIICLPDKRRSCRRTVTRQISSRSVQALCCKQYCTFNVVVSYRRHFLVLSPLARSAVGAMRFASRGFRLVSSRAREQNGGTTRGNRQREERGRPPARYGTTETGIDGTGKTDEDSTKEDNARATSPTRRKKVRHVANHVTGIRRGVRQNYADWTSPVPTTGNWLRTNVPRASLLQVVGV